jgi:hypothetical protein
LTALVHGITPRTDGTWVVSLHSGSILLWGFPNYTAASNFLFSYVTRMADRATDDYRKDARAKEQAKKWGLNE